MAESKAAEKAEAGSVTLLNKSLRIFDLGKDAAGNPRRHLPNTTMTYSAEEAKRMTGYRELLDISKMPGQVDAKRLQAENAKLLDENKRLKEQLLALEAPEPKASKSKESK